MRKEKGRVLKYPIIIMHGDGIKDEERGRETMTVPTDRSDACQAIRVCGSE